MAARDEGYLILIGGLTGAPAPRSAAGASQRKKNHTAAITDRERAETRSTIDELYRQLAFAQRAAGGLVEELHRRVYAAALADAVGVIDECVDAIDLPAVAEWWMSRRGSTRSGRSAVLFGSTRAVVAAEWLAEKMQHVGGGGCSDSDRGAARPQPQPQPRAPWWRWCTLSPRAAAMRPSTSRAGSPHTYTRKRGGSLFSFVLVTLTSRLPLTIDFIRNQPAARWTKPGVAATPNLTLTLTLIPPEL